MPRSIKKGPYVEDSLARKVEAMNKSTRKQPTQTWARRSRITPAFAGLTYSLHNGKTFLPIFITENMVGHRLGEFAPTRTFKHHGATTDKATK